MRVALSEGRLSKWEELLHELTPRQLTVLQAYYAVEPWGEERADLRESTMAAVVAHAFCGAKVDPNKLKNYIRGGEDEGQVLSPDSLAAQMREAFPSRVR